MSPAAVPTKDECIPVSVPEETCEKHRAIIERVFTWPDPIGFGVGRETIVQDTALVEFAEGRAVVWLRKASYGQAEDQVRQEMARRVFREWARL